MAGAAPESILLVVAIAKLGDEGALLALYKTSGGGLKVTEKITASVTAAIAGQFETALQDAGTARRPLSAKSRRTRA